MALLETLGWFDLLRRRYAYNAYVFTGPYYISNGPQAMETGVKIHISGTLASMERLANFLLPYLNAQGVFHKVLKDTNLIAEAPNDNQKRKFITVYPQDAQQLDVLAAGLDQILCSRECTLLGGPFAECYPIEGDLPYGRAGYIFLRHGNFVRDDPMDDRTRVSEKLQSYYLMDTVDGLFVPKRK